MKPKIFLAADHAGFRLKEYIKKYLLKSGYEVEDKGAFSINPNDDYPDFILPAAKEVAKDPAARKGIVLGGSGQGEAIAANKIRYIRAVVYYGGPSKILKLSKTHNNANILSLGARFLTKDKAIKAVKLWLATDFSNEARHARRIAKVNKLK